MEPAYPPSGQTGSGIMFFLGLPLIGLWFFFLLIIFKPSISKREEVRRIFVLHLFLFGYFFISESFLFFSFWIVPYFIEPVIQILLQINIVVVTMGFVLMIVWGTGGAINSWKGFTRYRILVKIWNWLFPNSSPT